MTRIKQIPETHHFILTDRPCGHLTTTMEDGHLTVNPVGLLWDGEQIRVPVLKTGTQYHNLVRDPRVAIAIPYRKSPAIYIEVRGNAELSDDADRSLVNAMAQHYLDSDVYPSDPDEQWGVITINSEQVSVLKIPLGEDAPQVQDPEFLKLTFCP